jgi:hypothetical protein
MMVQKTVYLMEHNIDPYEIFGPARARRHPDGIHLKYYYGCAGPDGKPSSDPEARGIWDVKNNAVGGSEGIIFGLQHIFKIAEDHCVDIWRHKDPNSPDADSFYFTSRRLLNGSSTSGLPDGLAWVGCQVERGWEFKDGRWEEAGKKARGTNKCLMGGNDVYRLMFGELGYRTNVPSGITSDRREIFNTIKYPAALRSVAGEGAAAGAGGR